MLKTPKTVAPSALTPKNIHCDRAHHSAGRGRQGRGQGPNMKMVENGGGFNGSSRVIVRVTQEQHRSAPQRRRRRIGRLPIGALTYIRLSFYFHFFLFFLFYFLFFIDYYFRFMGKI